jgi:hypothetical protein
MNMGCAAASINSVRIFNCCGQRAAGPRAVCDQSRLRKVFANDPGSPRKFCALFMEYSRRGSRCNARTYGIRKLWPTQLIESLSHYSLAPRSIVTLRIAFRRIKLAAPYKNTFSIELGSGSKPLNMMHKIRRRAALDLRIKSHQCMTARSCRGKPRCPAFKRTRYAPGSRQETNEGFTRLCGHLACASLPCKAS